MSRGRFGVGIIGCGGIAASHGEAWRMLDGDCELRAVSDIDEAAARWMMDRFEAPVWYPDWRDLLEDDRIRIVSICTPHHLHAPMTLAAARAGKHIVCEKPMALTAGEASEMIEACRSAGVKLSIGSERYNPRHRFIKERVLPELGRIEYSRLIDFYYRDAAYYARAGWRGTWSQEGGGVCANQAIYTWDLWQWFLGGVDLAYGYWANLLHPTIEVEDTACGLVFFKDGSHGKCLATSACDWGQGICGLRIFGERGTLRADDPWLYQMEFTLKDARLEAALRGPFEAAIDPAYAGAFQPWQAADMVAAIREDRDPLVSEALDALKILNGIHWHGYRHAGAFRVWADGLGLPESAEAARSLGWQGGEVMEALAGLVRDPSRRLPVPFGA
ncbi:MAG: Gfo/Idh/MocA family oxidoreductase [Armatimonadetes bacterium]|nr:Gfo/Idh/MocA family oxidoreductase [Armatimonadota bacterium]